MTSKKLLVLDVNGLLLDTYFYKEPLPEESPDARVGNFYVYKRPFCEEFLQFCLDNFMVGIWSSAREYNVNNLVDYVFGGMKEKLAFSWHQSDCTDLGLKSPDNQLKPLFLKELSKLWRRVKVGLPWSEGNYGPSNTLLVDDTPYKAILNPPNTAIFPRSYSARDRGDNFLGGALRSYLEGIRDAVSVQTYVEINPFGEPSITPASPLWSSVNEVLLKVKSVLTTVGDVVDEIIPDEAFSEEGSNEYKPRKCQKGHWEHHSDTLQPVEFATDEGDKEDKSKKWRVRKQNYHLDPSQLANSNLQYSDVDFPSEAIEVHSIELGSGVQVRDSTAEQVHELANQGSQEIVGMPLDRTDRLWSHLNQPFKDQERPFQVGKEISLPLRFEEPSKNEHQDKSTLFTELGNDGDGEQRCENTGFILSLEQGHHRAHEAGKQAAIMQEDLMGIDKGYEEENRTSCIHEGNHEALDKRGTNEGPFHITGTGMDAQLDRLHEQNREEADRNIHGEGNESFEISRIAVHYDSSMPSEPYCMQVENNNKELSCGRMRNSNFVRESNKHHASQHHLSYCNHRQHKHRGSREDLNKWCNKRNDTDRGSFRYSQGRKYEREYRQNGRTQIRFLKDLDQRGQIFTDNQHMKSVDRHISGNGYGNRSKPTFGHVRHHQQMWGDRPVDVPAQPTWRALTPDARNWEHSQQDCGQLTNTRFRELESNFSTQPFSSQRNIAGRVRKTNEYGRDQDEGWSSYSWHQGFEQGAGIGSSNIRPESTEQLNMNGHNPDSNLAVQATARGHEKRQRADFASKEAGPVSWQHRSTGGYAPSRQRYRITEASNPLSRNTGGFSQPYSGRHGASRQPYHSIKASKQQYHNNWDKYRGGFSRSRQSQEVRNW